MIVLFSLIATTFAAEYLQIEYNKGSYEISEFKKCYCYSDGCVTYEKSTDGKSVIEKMFKSTTKCEGEKDDATHLFGQNFDGLKYTVITSLPSHEYHYFESQKGDCTDGAQRAKVLLAKDNCELDYYSEERVGYVLYNTYTLKEENGKKKFVMSEFIDEQCKTPTMKESKDPNAKNAQYILESNQCNQIEGEGSFGKFYPNTYSLPAGTTPPSEYFQLEYNKGVFELYEFGKCYCFADDGCYKYVKNATDNTKVNEYYYDLTTQSNCTSTEGEPEPAVFILDKKAEKDITASIVNSIPTHQFYYIASAGGKCDEAANQQVNCYMTSDNCERDYYDDDNNPIYRTYRLVDGTGDKQGKKMIEIKQFKDSTCTTPRKEKVPFVTEYDADKCIDVNGGKIQLNSKKYEFPNNGTFGTFILAVLLTMIILF